MSNLHTRCSTWAWGQGQCMPMGWIIWMHGLDSAHGLYVGHPWFIVFWLSLLVICQAQGSFWFFLTMIVENCMVTLILLTDLSGTDTPSIANTGSTATTQLLPFSGTASAPAGSSSDAGRDTLTLLLSCLCHDLYFFLHCIN